MSKYLIIFYALFISYNIIICMYEGQLPKEGQIYRKIDAGEDFTVGFNMKDFKAKDEIYFTIKFEKPMEVSEFSVSLTEDGGYTTLSTTLTENNGNEVIRYCKYVKEKDNDNFLYIRVVVFKYSGYITFANVNEIAVESKIKVLIIFLVAGGMVVLIGIIFFSWRIWRRGYCRKKQVIPVNTVSYNDPNNNYYPSSLLTQ